MILAIVQARMSSARLPGKVMQEILGKPLLGYVFERLSYVKKINKIILATSVEAENNRLVEYVQSQKFDVCRGSEDDVLARVYEAARRYAPKAIVRVTGDNPLFDPKICDDLLEFYSKKKVDYACTGKSFAEGLDCEVFSFAALKTAFENAKLRSEREHVTAYLYKRPEIFKIAVMENETDDSHLRFTVDEPEDFEAVKAIIENLYSSKAKPFTCQDAKNFILQHPEISNKNAHVVRNEGYLKSLKEDRVA